MKDLKVIRSHEAERLEETEVLAIVKDGVG